LLSLFVAAAVGAAGGASPPNPLAMAEAGWIQCYRPDVENKTCRSIASYQRTGPGTYDNKALIAASTDATLEIHTPVVIKNGAVCGFVRHQDVIAGTLRIRGQILEPERAKPILERIAKAIAPLAHDEICTTYESSGDEFSTKVSVGGTFRPDMDETGKWIDPKDGYTVSP